MQHVLILSPLYNDEESFHRFASELKNVLSEQYHLELLVVNDGTPSLKLNSELPLTVLNLHRNLGHQKAIAIGLAYANENMKFDRLVIMDCDGEDRPEVARELLKRSSDSSRIIVAKRAGRQESFSYKFLYRMYKVMFFILTGKKTGFGNFMVLQNHHLNKLVYYGEIWNHLAGAVIKSKIGHESVKANKGRRYAGQSQMNFHSLLLHGLGAIGVFIEVIASRLLMLSLALIFVSTLAIVIITLIKMFTTQAIPGWASTVVSSMLVVMLQSFLLSLFTIFIYLSFQGQRSFVPALHYRDHLKDIEKNS